VGTLSHTNDLALFQSIAAEVNKLAGMICYYYRLDRESTARDPLYDEATANVYHDTPDGLKLAAYASHPEKATTAGEEGRRRQWDTNLWIAKTDWETATESDDPPQVGDIVNAWGRLHSVVDYDSDGILDDADDVFVGWKINMRRLSKYEASWNIIPR
jgi:hypothetical protein